MFEPGYASYLKKIALKGIYYRMVDVPSFELGVAPFEQLESIYRGLVVLTQPSAKDYGQTRRKGGIIPGQSYAGVPGFGDVVPTIDPADHPWYGERIGAPDASKS